MKVQKGYNLSTQEIKQALVQYINEKTGERHSVVSVNSFSVRQTPADIREYTVYIGFEEAADEI
jgi:hypothetical protein